MPFQALKCRLGMHHWGELEGASYGATHTCSFCGKTKRVGPDLPPDAHDKMDIHR